MKDRAAKKVTFPAFNLVPSPDNSEVAVLFGDAELHIGMLSRLDLRGKTWTPTAQRANAEDNGLSITAVSYAPNGKTIAIARLIGTEYRVELWDLERNAQIGASALIVGGPCRVLAFSASGDLLAAGGSATLNVWHIPTFTLRSRTAVENSSVRAIAFRDNQTLVIGFVDRPGGIQRAAVQEWSFGSGNPRLVLAVDECERLSLSHQPNGQLVLAAVLQGRGRFDFYDVEKRANFRSIAVRMDSYSAFADVLAARARARVFTVHDISADGKLLAVGYRNGSISLLGVDDGRTISVFTDHVTPERKQHNMWVTDIRFTPNGKFLLSSGLDGSVVKRALTLPDERVDKGNDNPLSCCN
jgi:WD40 repeat protein